MHDLVEAHLLEQDLLHAVLEALVVQHFERVALDEEQVVALDFRVPRLHLAVEHGLALLLHLEQRALHPHFADFRYPLPGNHFEQIIRGNAHVFVFFGLSGCVGFVGGSVLVGFLFALLGDFLHVEYFERGEQAEHVRSVVLLVVDRVVFERQLREVAEVFEVGQLEEAVDVVVGQEEPDQVFDVPRLVRDRGDQVAAQVQFSQRRQAFQVFNFGNLVVRNIQHS